MTWIKQNYDRFILALFAAGLAVCAALLFNNARNFASVFDNLKNAPNPDATIRSVDMKTLESERAKLAEPFVWKVRQIGNRQLPAFVSVPYIESSVPDGRGGFALKLIDPYEAGAILHPPIPNAWLIEHHLDMLAANVLTQDPDNDGFTNLDEWSANPQTDPNDKNSHPPYYTKLYLKRFVRVPFRLLFAARNGNVALINTLDADEATQFLHVGDLVKGTKFKMTKLEIKDKTENGIKKDASEVTLVNTETNEPIVLPKEMEVDSPTTYAVLTYLWNGGDVTAKPDFGVKKNQEFTIRPDTNVKYKCVNLTDTVVTVLKEDENKTLEIKMQPK